MKLKIISTFFIQRNLIFCVGLLVLFVLLVKFYNCSTKNLNVETQLIHEINVNFFRNTGRQPLNVKLSNTWHFVMKNLAAAFY